MTDPAPNPARRVIPNGRWQIGVGIALDLFGLFAALAATPFNGAGAVATFCLTVGSSFLFWGLMLRYFSALETKLVVLLQRDQRPGTPSADG